MTTETSDMVSESHTLETNFHLYVYRFNFLEFCTSNFWLYGTAHEIKLFSSIKRIHESSLDIFTKET